MGRRTSGLLLALGCLMLAGCGSGGTKRSAKAPALTPAQRCARAARLNASATFPGWQMGAVRFFSPTSGVGITAVSFPCFRPIKGGGEREIALQRQRVRLAVTSDGGRSWRIAGTSPPLHPVGFGGPEEIAALSRDGVWAVVGTRRLVATHDGGAKWQIQAVPTPVVDVTIDDGFVWAVSCPHRATRDAPGACQPELWRTRPTNGSWTRIALPRITTDYSGYVKFAATSTHLMLALPDANRDATDELLISNNAGSTWTMRSAPTWDHQRCELLGALALTARSPNTFWLLCLGGAAAGSSAKGLLRSTDGGVRWKTVSAVTSIVGPHRPGSIPLEEPSALAAGSQTRLWLSLTYGLAESNDGGRRWANVPRAVDTGGFGSTIDVLDATHAWMLSAGAGLWRTTDGLQWASDGPLNTGSVPR